MQEPWIFSSSVRNNILLGSNLDTRKYQNVLTMCALDHDINQWTAGDDTLVGERGQSLSGGQKSRIALARAAYHIDDFHVFLFDDPLSAVDQAVGKHILENCIKQHFSKKTVIMTTHNYQHLDANSHVMVLNQGKLLFEGSRESLDIESSVYGLHWDERETER